MIPKSIFDEDFGKGHIGWCSDKNIDRLFKLMEGTVFVPDNGTLKYIPIARKTKLELITCENPRMEFAKVLETYEPNLKTDIHPTVSIGKNTVIHEGTIIGKDVIIGDNCVIGGDGFGYIEDYKIEHRGNVVINEGVHIGSNTCIDRAVIGSTIIGENTKIDNLVHIAHGVKIGKSCKIIASSVLCGSVTLGNNVWVSPKAVIKNGITIGDEVVIGLGAVVINNVNRRTTVIGVPAKELKK